MKFSCNRSFLMTCLFWLLFTTALASTAAALSSAPSKSSADHNQCHAVVKEDEILCEAAKVKQASINQVIQEDEAWRDQEPHPEPRDPWAAAFEQWVIGKSPSDNKKGVNPALEEELKRYPSAKEAKIIDETVTLADTNDDELTVITAAVRNISELEVASEQLKVALDTIEELCNSGDNGRQMQAAGGVPHLLRHASSVSTDVSLLSIRALATCAQNNPIVFDSAVDEGAIVSMLKLADNGNDALRAASLRVLVAVSDSSKAKDVLQEEESDIVRVVLDSLRKNSGMDGTRCQIRALALVEQCLLRYKDNWKQIFASSGLVGVAEEALHSESVDVREGAARVLRMLR